MLISVCFISIRFLCVFAKVDVTSATRNNNIGRLQRNCKIWKEQACIIVQTLVEFRLH